MARILPPRACASSPDLSKKTVIAMYEVGSRTREWLESLDDDQWEITSFEPRSREVCVLVANNSSMHNISLTLPPLSATSAF